MSLLSKLQLGDNALELYNSEYSVVECRYNIKKGYNKSIHTIDDQINRAEIVLTVVAPYGSDFTLYSWYVDMMKLNGRVVIDLSSVLAVYNEQSCKTICFEDAYCIGIEENYNIDSLSRRELTIKLLARKIEVDAVELNVMATR